MREPELPRLLKRFVIMGGAYREPGNVTPSAEFNIWHDPEAARIVFRAFGGPGGDADGGDRARRHSQDDLRPERPRRARDPLGRHPLGPALTRFIQDASRHYFERMEKRTGKRILVMHDPLALAVALDPTLVETRRAAVDVETAGRLTTRRDDRRLARQLGPARQQPRSRSRSTPSASAGCSSTRWRDWRTEQAAPPKK